MSLPALVRFSQQDVYTSLTILGCTVNCRFRFADCPLIHCEIYPSELQLNKANTSDTEAAFLGLHLSISKGRVSSAIYDKCDEFDFDIANFPTLDGDVLLRPSYGVYISQLIRFARVCSHVDDLNR